jgi:hypothetical protein
VRLAAVEGPHYAVALLEQRRMRAGLEGGGGHLGCPRVRPARGPCCLSCCVHDPGRARQGHRVSRGCGNQAQGHTWRRKCHSQARGMQRQISAAVGLLSCGGTDPLPAARGPAGLPLAHQACQPPGMYPMAGPPVSLLTNHHRGWLRADREAQPPEGWSRLPANEDLGHSMGRRLLPLSSFYPP